MAQYITHVNIYAVTKHSVEGSIKVLRYIADGKKGHDHIHFCSDLSPEIN